MMSEIEQKYAGLKKMIIDNIGEKYDLEQLKNYFKSEIDSSRAYRRIKTVTDLITILEQRDVLNYQCPMALFYMGEILKNENVTHFVSFYKKTYLDNHLAKCCCGKELDFHPKTSVSVQLEGNNYKPSHSNSELMDAIKNVSRSRYGASYWRVIASELDIRENVIEEIYEKHPTDKEQQAYAALKHWVEREKENATIKHLDKALDARLCKRRGIGSHLRKPLNHLNS